VGEPASRKAGEPVTGNCVLRRFLAGSVRSPGTMATRLPVIGIGLRLSKTPDIYEAGPLTPDLPARNLPCRALARAGGQPGRASAATSLSVARPPGGVP